jgi:hypothetical protein
MHHDNNIPEILDYYTLIIVSFFRHRSGCVKITVFSAKYEFRIDIAWEEIAWHRCTKI